MCRELKVLPDRFRDVIGLRDNVEKHLEKLPRPRRRAIWSGISNLLKHGIFSAKFRLNPYIQMSVDDGVHQFGAIHHGGCVSVIGISKQKLTVYAIIDKLRLLKRAGQKGFCTVLDQKVGNTISGRIRVVIVEHRFIAWSADVDLRLRISQFLMELFPGGAKPIWQEEKPLHLY
jgi:hypothetical protein